MDIYIYIHNVLLYLDDGEGMKHHKVSPVHACTCFESGVFPERPNERGYCKGKFLHTQTSSAKQSLTTMIRDMSVVAKLMQMVDGQMVDANGSLDGIFFHKVIFFGPFFRLKLQTQSSRRWVDYQPTWTSITHIPSPISGLNWSWDVAWKKGFPQFVLSKHIWSLFLQH